MLICSMKDLVGKQITDLCRPLMYNSHPFLHVDDNVSR